MKFEEALSNLRAGARMRRASWSDKAMFVYMVNASMFNVNRPPLNRILEEGTEVNYQPHLDIIDTFNRASVYSPSQLDLFATDWELL